MLYALIGEDVPNSLDLRLQARPEHLARLDALQSEGRLVLAGPCPAIDSPDPGPAGFSGTLIVAEFGSQTEAETWLNGDPYVTRNIFHKITVKPFKQVFPK